MKVDESKIRHDILINMVKEQTTAIEKENLHDLEEEVEDEMAEVFAIDPTIKPHILKRDIELPAEKTVVTWNLDGTPRNYFGDPSWDCEDEIGFPLNFNFYYSEVVDLSSELCSSLVYFLKLMVYFKLPGKDPFSVSSSYRTTKNTLQNMFYLCSLLKSAGYLYGKEEDCLDLSTIDVEWFRDELNRIIDNDEGLTVVDHLSRALGTWASISAVVALPPAYAAKFTKKQLFHGGLHHRVTNYAAHKRQPWETIEFVDLVKMFKMTKVYLDHYVDDVLFIVRQLNLLFKEDKERRKSCTSPIQTTGWTREIAEAILKHEYAVDPESGKPWFTPGRNSPDKKGRTSLDKACLKRVVDNMMNVCIFQMFIWTAARKSEIRSLKAGSLLINGEPLSLDIDALDQIRNGKSFELTRVETKTDKGVQTLPLPRKAATAFAVLVEIFRDGRRGSGNPFLLPQGYLGHGHRAESRHAKGKANPISGGSLYSYFAHYCELAGVKHYHPHRCRKTLATILINYDPRCIELIKDLLCHKDINMTRQYLMSLPGVADEARRMFVAQQNEKVIELIVSGSEGKLAGPAGDRASAAILRNTDAFKGSRLTDTTTKLLDVLVQQGNFVAVRTPTAWCLRFNSRAPWDAPCLPKQEKRQKGEILEPNYDKCQDWLCKFSGYTPSDLEQIRRRKAWAGAKGSSANSSASRAHFEGMINYFDGILAILENGRPEIVGLQLVDAALAEIGTRA